jgi:polysaccharide pyruvyl transferase WcaK-like protein
VRCRRPSVRVIGSGWLSSEGSSNFGDRAQLLTAVSNLGRLGFDVTCVAHSKRIALGDVAAVESRTYIDYLLGAGEGRGSGTTAVAVAVRAASLVLVATLTHLSRRPLSWGNSLSTVLRELDSAAAVFVSGNGTLSDPYVRSVGVVWGVYLLAARLMGRKVYMTGQQVGPFQSYASRQIARAVLSCAHVIGVRELESLDEVRNLGFAPDRTVVTGDEAWDAAIGQSAVIEEASRSHGVADGYVVAQVRFDVGTGWDTADASYLASVLDGVARSIGLPVLFVGLQVKGGRSADLDAARHVAAQMSCTHSFLDSAESAEVVKGVIGKAAAAIGVSNHFCVFAACQAVPTLALHTAPYLGHKLVGLARLWPTHVRAMRRSTGTFTSEDLESATAFLKGARGQRMEPSVAVDAERVYRELASSIAVGA